MMGQGTTGNAGWFRFAILVRGAIYAFNEMKHGSISESCKTAIFSPEDGNFVFFCIEGSKYITEPDAMYLNVDLKLARSMTYNVAGPTLLAPWKISDIHYVPRNRFTDRNRAIHYRTDGNGSENLSYSYIHGQARAFCSRLLTWLSISQAMILQNVKEEKIWLYDTYLYAKFMRVVSPILELAQAHREEMRRRCDDLPAAFLEEMADMLDRKCNHLDPFLLSYA